MIQFDKDGVTLTGVDATGQKFSAGWMEGGRYNAMLTTRSAQIVTADANTNAVANYNTVLANAQLNVDNGHDVPAPPKPLQKFVSDTGVESFAPFNPPLADLVPRPPIVGNGQMFAPGAGPTGTIATAEELKKANLYNMVFALFRKAFPDAA